MPIRAFGRTPSISFFDCTIVLILLWLFGKNVVGTFSFSRQDHTLNALMTLYLLATFLSFLFSLRDPQRSFLAIKVIVLGYCVYWIALSVISTRHDLELVTAGLVIFGCAISILLLRSYFEIWSGGLSSAASVTDTAIVKSQVEMAGNRSNYLASLLLPILPISFARIFISRGRRILFWIGSCIVLAAGIFATMSRGATVGLAIGTLCAAGILRDKILRPKNLAMTLWIISTFLLMVPKDLLVANYALFSQMFASTDFNRIDLWRTAWMEFLKNPFFGVGPGCIYLYNSQFAIDVLYSHNYLLNTLADVGLVGTVPFVLILCVLSQRAYKLACMPIADPTAKVMGIGLFAGLMATLAHGLVEPTFVAQEYLVIFWVVIALVSLYARCYSVPRKQGDAMGAST